VTKGKLSQRERAWGKCCKFRSGEYDEQRVIGGGKPGGGIFWGSGGAWPIPIFHIHSKRGEKKIMEIATKIPGRKRASKT